MADSQPNSSAAMGIGQGGAQDATAAAGAAVGGDVGTTYPEAPAIADDRLGTWLQAQIDALGDSTTGRISVLERKAAEADEALAKLRDQGPPTFSDGTPDPTQNAPYQAQLAAARATQAQAHKDVQDAHVAQDKYLNQYQAVQARAQKQAEIDLKRSGTPLTPEQKAEYDTRMAGYAAQQNALQAQIEQNNAARDLDAQKLQHEIDVFNHDNSPEALARDAAYKEAQTHAQDAATAASKAQTDNQNIQNNILSTYGAEQAGATVASTKAATSASEAQTRAYDLETQVNAEKLRQQQEGAGVTLHRQLTEWIAAAPDDATAAQRERDADAEWTQFQSGGSQLDWQTKLNDTAVTLTDNLAARGMLTSGRGLDPTGAISKALGNVGIDWQEPTPQLTSIPGWAKAAGINLQAPQYSVGGATAQPVAAGATGVPAQPVAPAVIDHTGQSWEQIKASMQQPQAAPAAVTTTAPAQPVAVVAHGGGAVPGPIHAARGAVVYAVPGWARGGRY